MVVNFEESFFSDLLLKKQDGTILIIKSLAHLQQKIVLHEVLPDDLFSKNGKDWEKLNKIESLEPFFKLIESKPEPRHEPKIDVEAAEKERIAKIEKERADKLEAEKKAAAEVAEKERVAKLEAERKAAAEVAEKERIAKLEAEKKAAAEVAEKERVAKLEAERKAAAEVAEKERVAKLEQEKTIAEIAEKVRIAKLEPKPEPEYEHKMTPTIKPEDNVMSPKNGDSQKEFDSSFFDDEDLPKKRPVLKIIVIFIILGIAAAAIYFFFIPKNEEKRIVAEIPEETVQKETEVPAIKEEPVETVKTDPVPVVEKTPETVLKNEEPVIQKTAKKEPIQKKQESTAALCKQGWQLLDKGNHAKAISIFKNVLAKKAGYADAHLGLGESYNAAGNKNEAKKHYKKYLELKPDAEDRLEIESILNNL